MIRSLCSYYSADYQGLATEQLPRAKYRFGKTLGAGTYGIVREADGPLGKCAVKIILKKNVKGNEQMVYDEMEMLQRMKHPHIVKFYEWFESKVSGTSLTHAVASDSGSDRTSTTLSPNLPLVASYLTGSAKRASSPRKTLRRPSVKY